jgi:hypothetical protein
MRIVKRPLQAMDLRSENVQTPGPGSQPWKTSNKADRPRIPLLLPYVQIPLLSFCEDLSATEFATETGIGRRLIELPISVRLLHIGVGIGHEGLFR